jgi:hypothetical protein
MHLIITPDYYNEFDRAVVAVVLEPFFSFGEGELDEEINKKIIEFKKST